MLGSGRLWGPPEKDETVAVLVSLATVDCADIGLLRVEVDRRIGRAASLRDFAEALGELVGVLIDLDVVPGERGAEPELRPWPGTRQERVDRVVRETLARFRRPRPGDIAWFHHLPRTRAEERRGAQAG